MIDSESKFTSFRKVLLEHPDENIRNSLELISFYDGAHGVFPEPNIQGVIVNFENIDDVVMEMYLKFRSIMLCSSSPSQLAVDT